VKSVSHANKRSQRAKAVDQASASSQRCAMLPDWCLWRRCYARWRDRSAGDNNRQADV